MDGMKPIVDRVFSYPSLPQLEVRQRMPGKKPESHCRLRIFKSKGSSVVVVSECEENTGASARDATPYLAAMVCREYGIAPDALVWIVDDPEAESRLTWLTLEEAAPPVTAVGQDKPWPVLRVADAKALPPFAARELIGADIE